MEKIKISFKGEPKFYHSVSNDTGKHITICDLLGVLKIPNFYDEFLITSTGKAICDTSDIYDKTLGEKIALARAENMSYEKAATILDKYVNNLETELNKLYKLQIDFDEKAANSIIHNEKYIEDITR